MPDTVINFCNEIGVGRERKLPKNWSYISLCVGLEDVKPIGLWAIYYKVLVNFTRLLSSLAVAQLTGSTL